MKIITRDEARSRGLARYFTGVPCKHGHVAERQVSSNACIVCNRASVDNYRCKNRDQVRQRSRAYYHENRESIIESRKLNIDPVKERLRARVYREANRERINAKAREWRAKNGRAYYLRNWQGFKDSRQKYYKAHKAKIVERTLAYIVANRDKIRHRQAAYYIENKEHILNRCKNWAKANSDKRRARGAVRRVKILGAVGRVSKDVVAKLMRLQRGRCACCGKSLSAHGYHLDHIVPIALGGLHEDANLQLLTPTCNLQKAAKPPHDFMRSRGFLL